MTNNNDHEQTMQEQLETAIRLKKAVQEGTGFTKIWEICHNLAEAKYQPALEFLLEGLSDPDWDWRQKCLQLVGFHYDIPPESMFIDKVRKMLSTDPDDNVRMTAANVLGAISSLPDHTLVEALNSDPDWFVRRSAYFALLDLAGISYEVYLRERDRFDSETHGMEPTVQDVKRILEEEGIEMPANTFGSVDLNE